MPSGDYEIPLLIQDRSFLADGTLWYPPATNGTHPMWMQEYFGEIDLRQRESGAVSWKLSRGNIDFEW